MSIFSCYERNDYQEIQKLLNEQHPDIERISCGGYTLLAEICRKYKKGDERYVKLLLEKGANPNFSRWEESGNQEFFGHERVISLLFQNLYGPKETLIEIESLLLQHGAEVNYSVYDIDYTKVPGAVVRKLVPNKLLHGAVLRTVSERDPQIIALLVKHGIIDHNNHQHHTTSLQYLKGIIKKYSSSDRVKYHAVTEDCILLLERGFPAYSEKQQRLLEAKQKAEKLAEEKLRQEQAQKEVEARQRQEELQRQEEARQRALEVQKEAQSKQSVYKTSQVKEVVLEHDYNTQQLYHLHYKKDLEGFKALLESGYDPNFEVSGWGSILIQVCMSKSSLPHEYVDLLIKHGANPDAVSKDNQYCPLKMALINKGGSDSDTFKSLLKTVKLLLDAGANPNFPPAVNNHPGWGRVYTPLQDAVNLSFAIGQGSTEMVELLLSYGSRDVENKNGHTTLDALKNRRPPYFQGPRPYPNFDEFVTILELGHEKYQKLKQERLVELQRQAELKRVAEEEKRAAEEKRLAETLNEYVDSLRESAFGTHHYDPLGLNQENVISCPTKEKEQLEVQFIPWSREKSLEQCRWERNQDLREAWVFGGKHSRNPIAASLKKTHKVMDRYLECKDETAEFYSPRPRRHPARVDFPQRGVTADEHNAVIEGIEQDRADKIRLMMDSGIVFGSYDKFKLFFQKHRKLPLEEFQKVLESELKSKPSASLSLKGQVTNRQMNTHTPPRKPSGKRYSLDDMSISSVPPRPSDVLISFCRSRREVVVGVGGYGSRSQMTTEEVEEDRVAKIQMMRNSKLAENYDLMRSFYSQCRELSLEDFKSRLDIIVKKMEEREEWFKQDRTRRKTKAKFARTKAEKETDAMRRKACSRSSRSSDAKPRGGLGSTGGYSGGGPARGERYQGHSTGEGCSFGGGIKGHPGCLDKG